MDKTTSRGPLQLYFCKSMFSDRKHIWIRAAWAQAFKLENFGISLWHEKKRLQFLYWSLSAISKAIQS